MSMYFFRLSFFIIHFFYIPLSPKNENNPTMAEETQFDQLQRLVHLNAEPCEQQV